ncbi:hypothetical protein [Wolbachia endosymbiont of Pentidionis agamae]|uniref:hypothetical protein n=1 Tax=Wolbachia endosymbiont of Pentidionis agamae TaxID=3110435 RepID=UPI002FD6153A
MDAFDIDWKEYLKEENQSKISGFIESTKTSLVNKQDKVEFLQKFVETLDIPCFLKKSQTHSEKVRTYVSDPSVEEGISHKKSKGRCLIS